MFTGIVTATTEIIQAQPSSRGLALTLATPQGWDDLVLGESIATNGPCLTVSAIRDNEYDCFLVPETLAKTSFGKQVPRRVNLERSLAATDRFGGHFVQGHVDGVGIVQSIDESDGYRMSVKFPAEFKALVIPKGSITLNGVSLTVATLDDTVLTVALIPHTLQHTTLGMLVADDPINMEFDMVGKYIVNMTEHSNAASTKS